MHNSRVIAAWDRPNGTTVMVREDGSAFVCTIPDNDAAPRLARRPDGSTYLVPPAPPAGGPRWQDTDFWLCTCATLNVHDRDSVYCDDCGTPRPPFATATLTDHARPMGARDD